MLRDVGRSRSTPVSRRGDSAAGTLIALLLSTLVPILMAAVALGWRPPALERVEQFLAGRQTTTAAVAPPDWALPNGHFFVARASSSSGTTPRGFAVVDSDNLPLWSTYQALGGVTYLGYPISRRFNAHGDSQQLFQRVLLRGQAGGEVTPAALLDDLHAAGFDDELAQRWGIPSLQLPATGASAAGAERINWLLGDRPALRAFVTSAPDAQRLLGVPTSSVHDMGAYYIVRFQNGALQEWKQDVPWAKAGDVTVANVGEMAAELGYIAGEMLSPEEQPSTPPPSG